MLEYVNNILNIRYARNTLSTIFAHWHTRIQSTIVCQEYLKPMGMPGIPYVLEYVKNMLNIRYARNTLSTILAHWHIRTQSTIVCQEYQKHMGMPGIPYVLESIRNILSTRYARNTFSLICTQNIKHNIMPENLGLWVCQAYLMCWNM